MEETDQINDLSQGDYLSDDLDIILEKENLPTFQEFKDSNFGRPTKYLPDFPERLFNHFIKPLVREVSKRGTSYGKPVIKTTYETERLPTVESFCLEQCIGESTFYDYVRDHEDFSEVYKLSRARMKDILVQNILDGTWGIKAGSFIACNFTELREQIRNDDSNVGSDDGGTLELPYDPREMPVIEAESKEIESGDNNG